jgi:hypothetical protein
MSWKKLLRMVRRAILILPFLFQPTWTQPMEVQFSVTIASHGDIITFPKQFSAYPVVLTSAQIGGKAISSAAVNLKPSNFLLFLTDDQGNSVSNAWVQWIAFIPNQFQEVIGGVVIASHGQHISFQTLSKIPVIVTNAQKAGKALISGAMNNAQDGFDLYLVDDQGNPVNDAWLLWMAVVPDIGKNGFNGEVSRRNNGDNVSFSPPFPGIPAYVLSAQPGVIAGAVNNRQDGFTLSLVRYDGTAAMNVWTQWLGFAGAVTNVSEVEEIPKRFALYQNYPNPFNPSTTIEFKIPERTNVKLIVYDILGREIEILIDKELEPGKYRVNFSAGDLPSGIYFYRLEAGKFINVKRMVLVK